MLPSEIFLKTHVFSCPVTSLKRVKNYLKKFSTKAIVGFGRNCETGIFGIVAGPVEAESLTYECGFIYWTGTVRKPTQKKPL